MMNDVILKVEGISKQYRLGLVGTGTLKDDLNRWWYKVRGKDDPFLKIGEKNDRSVKGDSNYVWALNDINFEVKKGEVLGIIGRNGAGKSTLLKILSRVTSPTTGVIKSKGRIASLLEVGTGFHPEMTGRENIYLNGAILGMTKAEIRQKEEEIIAFSGCEGYIDTPVKRYSSGMHVRLAFAVAAHLEPDILVIDEVLAVGDAEFQKKAIGKMQDISKGLGRTVLFVSHNMSAIQSLCTRVLLLDNGRLVKMKDSTPLNVIGRYLSLNKKNLIYKVKLDEFNVEIDQKKIYDFKEELKFTVTINYKNEIENQVYIDFAVVNQLEEFVLHYRMNCDCEPIKINKGIKNILFKVNNPGLVLGEYSMVFYIYNKDRDILFWVENSANFQISNLSKVSIANSPVKSNVIPNVKLKFN
jgi:lipopolysaccharide transport system ATP-binding protein